MDNIKHCRDCAYFKGHTGPLWLDKLFKTKYHYYFAKCVRPISQPDKMSVYDYLVSGRPEVRVKDSYCSTERSDCYIIDKCGIAAKYFVEKKVKGGSNGE